MTFKAVLSGFKTKEDAKSFLSWYEGHGEQMGVEEWTGKHFMTDVKTGMIDHPDGVEYKVITYE